MAIKASSISKNPLTLIGDFTNPLGIAATVVVIALVLGCAGQLVQLIKPLLVSSTKAKKGGSTRAASTRSAKKPTPKAKAAAPASAAKRTSSSARKATPKSSSAAKKSTAAANLVSPTRTSTRTRTPAKKYAA
ncbi:unnamed protein product [Bathycoccus prasinos]